MTTATQVFPQVLNNIGNTILGNNFDTHGEFGAFAETYNELHRAYLAGVLRTGRELSPVDSFAMQILGKLSRLANSTVADPNPFSDIAGFGAQAAAYLVAKGMDAQKAQEADREAQEGRQAAFARQSATLTGRRPAEPMPEAMAPTYDLEEGQDYPTDLSPGTVIRGLRNGRHERIGTIGDDGGFVSDYRG